MAPPANRRTGYSRRAQYGLFIGYVVAVGGVVLAILLLVAAMVDPRGFAALRGAALDATVPISSSGRGVVRFFGDGAEAIGAYVQAGSQNAALKEELRTSRQRLIEARSIALENARLKRLLRLRDATADAVVTARIVGSTFDSSRRLATLSAGSSQGVRPGQPVRAAEGLIGRVIETGRHASRVLLITDGANFVPVRLVRNGTPALSSGAGDGTLDVRALTAGANPFRRGDIFVTSGTGGIYAPNIAVAIVVRVDGDKTVARPLADPSRADFAIVQKVYQPLASAPLTDAATEAAP